MLTTDERRKLRDEKVFAKLSKRAKQPKKKREYRPPDAKMLPALPEPEKGKESPKPEEQ